MPNHVDLEPSARWRELRTTPDDWSGVAPAALESMLVSSHLIRAFEEKVLELAGQGLVHGPAHSAIGQEGGAVGSAALMRSTDHINGPGSEACAALAIRPITGGWPAYRCGRVSVSAPEGTRRKHHAGVPVAAAAILRFRHDRA